MTWKYHCYHENKDLLVKSNLCPLHTLHNSNLVGRMELYQMSSCMNCELTSSVFEISGVTLQFVNIGWQNSLERMSSNEELDGLREQLLEQILAQNWVFFPEETMKTKSVILIFSEYLNSNNHTVYQLLILLTTANRFLREGNMFYCSKLRSFPILT